MGFLNQETDGLEENDYHPNVGRKSFGEANDNVGMHDKSTQFIVHGKFIYPYQ